MEQKPIMQLNEELGAMLKVPKQKLFEEFLQEFFNSQYNGLDDDMPDAFDTWISELDTQEVMDYAQRWGNTLTF